MEKYVSYKVRLQRLVDQYAECIVTARDEADAQAIAVEHPELLLWEVANPGLPEITSVKPYDYGA